jgi:hypothetical protein
MTSKFPNSTIPNQHRIDKGAMLSATRKMSIILLILGLALLSVFYFKNDQAAKIPAHTVATTNDFTPKPIRVKISTLNIDASVEDLGLNADGTLAVPKKDENVGWFTDSPAPGAVGPSVLVGHLDSIRGRAVFYNLKNIKIGDEVVVEREDGSRVVFRVEQMETYSQDNFPTDKVYGPISFAGIRLITCSGTYSRLKGHYSDNLVVYGRLARIENK